MNSGYIFKKTRKNTIATMVWAVLLFIFYLWYMITSFVYLPNAYSSGYKFDANDFLSSVDTLTIKAQDEPFPTSLYNVTVPPFFRKSELYFDGLKYKFKLTITDYKEVGLGYKFAEDLTFDIMFGNETTKILHPSALQKVALINIGGKNVVALLPTSTSIKDGDVVSRVLFTELPWYIGHDLGLTEYTGTEVVNYVADLRGITVEDETTDFILMILFTFIFPVFLAYSILCLINPKFHFNYIRIAKFGDVEQVCKEIDEEITQESVYKEKKTVYTPHYIIEETLYSTKVRKNHMLRH